VQDLLYAYAANVAFVIVAAIVIAFLYLAYILLMYPNTSLIEAE